MSARQQARWFTDPARQGAQTATIRSILVATDLSEGGQQAVDRVALLSGQLGATATLLHIDNACADREPERRFAPLRRETPSPAASALARMSSELYAAHAIEVQTETRRGDVLEQILLRAKTTDLLALSSKRRNPLHRLVFGSIPGRLVDRCRTPMLVVKQAPRQPYRRVLVLTDFSAGSIAAAELAARIAPEAELHLFHALDLRDDREMRFAEVPEPVIRKLRLSARADAQVRMDKAVESIGASASRFAQTFGHGRLVPLALLKQRALDSDLLVVARSVRPVGRSFLFWSTARRLSDDCPCDVLVVPTRDDNLAGRLPTITTGCSEQAA